MWDLIVSVPDYCLSFYLEIPRVYAETHITAKCVDAQISPLWSFPKFGRTQKCSTHRAEFLRMNANVNFLEFLRICTDFSSVKFVWTYAKSLHAQGGVSCICTQVKTSGVSADMRRLLLCGVSATYAKSSAPLLSICVSTQINNFWSFCGYAQLLEPEKVTLAPTIRRSSNTGVSASVR